MQGSNREEKIITETREWIWQVVIGNNFCPFARREFESNQIRFRVFDGHETEAALTALFDEIIWLDQHDEKTTTMLIFSDMLQDFEAFLDFVELADELIDLQGYRGKYQLAHFHPRYCFEGNDIDDAANYTNRSPWPMLHLINEDDIESARAHFPGVEDIPRLNIKLARFKGKRYFDNLIERITGNNENQ